MNLEALLLFILKVIFAVMTLATMGFCFVLFVALPTDIGIAAKFVLLVTMIWTLVSGVCAILLIGEP